MIVRLTTSGNVLHDFRDDVVFLIFLYQVRHLRGNTYIAESADRSHSAMDLPH